MKRTVFAYPYVVWMLIFILSPMLMIAYYAFTSDGAFTLANLTGALTNEMYMQVLLRSVCDRTLFVLGRAVTAAAPAGLLLWLMANLTVDGCSLLSRCAAFLDPFARLMGLDGVILSAFILGLPANEIVIPIILMAYLSQGTLQDPTSLTAMRELFLANGWSSVTALCTMLFSLMHWPCATTLITIKKETGSRKWTALAAVLPTLCGMAACMLVNAVGSLFL